MTAKSNSAILPKIERRQAPYSVFAKIYDQTMGDALSPLIWRSFEAALRRYRIPFTSAADIGCGTGTFLRYLSGFGLPLFGVDRSKAMLNIAAKKNPDSRVTLLKQDITELKLPRKVDLITCNFDTVNYVLSLKQLRKTFMRCHTNLSDGGHFVFDAISGAKHRQDCQRAIQKIRMPDISSIWIISWNPMKKISIVWMHYLFRDKNGNYKRVQEEHKQRWYPIPLLCGLLQNSGFILRGVHDMETFLPATTETFWVKYIAQRNEAGKHRFSTSGIR